MVIAGWPIAEFEENKKDIEGNYLKTLGLAPAFAERLRGAKREARFFGAVVTELLPQAIRPRLGARRAMRPITRTRSPRRASPTLSARPSAVPLRWTRCSAARARSTKPWANTSAARDERVLPMYEFTCQLATLEPPPPEMQKLIGAIHGRRRPWTPSLR